jgi:hypothetical protein
MCVLSMTKRATNGRKRVTITLEEKSYDLGRAMAKQDRRDFSYLVGHADRAGSCKERASQKGCLISEAKSKYLHNAGNGLVGKVVGKDPVDMARAYLLRRIRKGSDWLLVVDWLL